MLFKKSNMPKIQTQLSDSMLPFNGSEGAFKFIEDTQSKVGYFSRWGYLKRSQKEILYINLSS